MKRVQMFLAGAFIAVGSLYAQSSDAEWQMEVAKLKETIQSDPAQAAEQAEQLIKGKIKECGTFDSYRRSLFAGRQVVRSTNVRCSC